MIVSPRCTRRAAAPFTRHRPRAALAGDRVGLEARAVVDVETWTCSCSRMSAASSRSGSIVIEPDVVQVAVGDRRPVDLGLEHYALHQAIAFLGSG